MSPTTSPDSGYATSELSLLLVAEQLKRSASGGIGTYAYQLIRACALNGPVPLVVTSKGPLAKKLKLPPGVERLTTPVGHRTTGWLWERDKLRLADPTTTATVNSAQTHRAQTNSAQTYSAQTYRAQTNRAQTVIHATSFHFPSPHRGQKLTVLVHDLAWLNDRQLLNARGAAFHDRGLKRTNHLASAILVPSRRTADALMQHGFDGKRITVVGEGADHLPDPDPSRPDPVHPYFISVSTIEPRKNLPRLIAAYEALREELRASTPDLRVVGPKGWGSTELKPVQGVSFLGRMTEQELANHLGDAVALVYVPLEEGFGLPPVEAMRVGVPVICSDTVPSVTEPDVDDPRPWRDNAMAPALIVNATDTAAIMVAMRTLASSEQAREDIARRALEAVQPRTWVRVAERHHNVWRETCRGPR